MTKFNDKTFCGLCRLNSIKKDKNRFEMKIMTKVIQQNLSYWMELIEIGIFEHGTLCFHSIGKKQLQPTRMDFTLWYLQ